MKKLICLVLAAIIVCALVGCNSVSQSDIDDLQQRITQLESKNKELEDELHDQKLKYEDKLTQQEHKYEDKLNEQKSEYEDKLNEQDKKIEDMQKDLDYLEQKAKGITGTFYNLGTAYDNGWLTREDVMHISYFRFGEVIEYDSDTKTEREIEFEPTMPEPKLMERVEADIKYTYYMANKTDFNMHGIDEKNVYNSILIDGFYGEYNGCYVVRIRVAGMLYPGTVERILLGGIRMWDPYPLMNVFKY